MLLVKKKEQTDKLHPMKKSNYPLKILSFLIGAILFSACTNFIDPAKTEPARPTLSFATRPEIINQDATAKSGAQFVVNLKGVIGDRPLRKLTVQQVLVNVTPERIKINGAEISSNPIFLSGNDITSFNYTISAVAHSNTSTQVYSFILEDDANLKALLTLSVTTESVVSAVLFHL
jgi:hypothetical protein